MLLGISVSLLNCLVGGLLAAEPAPLGIAHKPIPDKLVIPTFDDGCASHATFVAPILKEMGFGGSFYVSNFGSFSTRKDWYLTWQQMKEMADAGIEIDNHTHGHCGGASIGPFLRMEEQFSANGVPRSFRSFGYSIQGSLSLVHVPSTPRCPARQSLR